MAIFDNFRINEISKNTHQNAVFGNYNCQLLWFIKEIIYFTYKIYKV